jgi:hypothetical protein
MIRPLPWFLTLALAGGVLAAPPYDFVESKRPRARKLEFATALSRVRYRSEVNTEDTYRKAGQKAGKTRKSETSRQFQSSVWEVPGGSGILRVENAPLRVGAMVGKEKVGLDLGRMPVAVSYMRRTGIPCTYWGKELRDRKATALVFPEKEIGPGDKWTREVPASRTFQLPTSVEFRYLREGRVGGRLCAELASTASASGQLPDGSGMMTMKVESTFLYDVRLGFLYDVRLGRVLYSSSRLHQTMIGRVDQGSPPPKRRIDEVVEMMADL